jgi:hypothetical protein
LMFHGGRCWAIFLYTRRSSRSPSTSMSLDLPSASSCITSSTLPGWCMASTSGRRCCYRAVWGEYVFPLGLMMLIGGHVDYSRRVDRRPSRDMRSRQ